MLYKWNMETNAVDNMNACKGHERSVDCLAADREGKFIASGSFDTTLKIWGGKLQGSGFCKNMYKIPKYTYFLNARKSSWKKRFAFINLTMQSLGIGK